MKLFLIAEAVILVVALVVAVLRSLPGPVFFPLRALAVAYIDLFRGIPTVLVIYILGFGAPALELSGVPTSPLFWGIVSLVLVYIGVRGGGLPRRDRVGAPEPGGGRALARAHARQALRYVVLPQAVRRVVPPLLNDFIGLQKDTALVALIGPIEAFRQSQIDRGLGTSTTRRTCDRVFFVVAHDPARAADRLADRARPAAAARDRRTMSALRSRASTSRSASSRCCAGSTSRSPSTRSSA